MKACKNKNDCIADDAEIFFRKTAKKESGERSIITIVDFHIKSKIGELRTLIVP